jgi:putative spermidine/putrescine transport system permease protein
MITFPPEGLSLKWYAKIAGATDLRDAFLRSLVVASICTAVAIPTGTLAGIALAKYRVRLAGAIQVYLLLPFTVPLIGSGIGLMLVFGRWGVLGQLWPVGVAAAVINLPFMIWAVTASAAALDPDLELAAANCGAPPLSTFLAVTVPAVMPGIITGALLMFILALNEFLVSLLLVDARIVTLPVQIYNSIRSIITPDLAAISVVFIAVAAAAIALLDRLVGLDIFLKSK